MKEKLEKLYELAQEFHDELTQLAQEMDSSEMWEAEGHLQDVKDQIRQEYSKHL